MKTLLTKDNISRTAEILVNGGLVAVPTETVYGLAGCGLNESAVKKIYMVKGRPEIKPLSLMVHDKEAFSEYCIDVPPQAYVLADKFWPGPLTIVLKAAPNIPSIVLAGGATVGLRCPDHPLTLRLLEACKLPLAAPSANPSGEESPKNAGKVMEYFDGAIDAVLDGGECDIGLESTIIDMSSLPYRILRQGALPEKDIAAALTEKMTVIGITGGTGCGKTTALRELEKMGALVLDCDAVYHELLENNTEMISELNQSFPGAAKDGEIDRKALGALVFADAAKLVKLNSITHKYVTQELLKRLESFAFQGGTLAAIDAVELLSSGLSRLCTATLAVLADKETRVKRIMARDSISEAYARSRIEAQRPAEYYENNCEYVLYNNADESSFASACRRLFREVINNG